MRTYEPIWNAIKKHGRIMVQCSPDLQRRIIKAVKKEKWMDAEWKEEGTTKLECNRQASGIVFTLHDFRPLQIAMRYNYQHVLEELPILKAPRRH